MIKSNRRHTLFANNKYRKKESNTMDFDDFFKKATILPNKQKPKQLEELETRPEQQQDTIEQQDNNESTQEEVTTKETKKATVDTSEILKGVIACVDVRTEDGDVVSHRYESAVKSMGGETRKIFSDNVTHFVFKNGSNATLKKAISKGIFIINLLWVSKCRSEGRRLDEKDFLYDQPLALVLTEKRKRRTKSMKPNKVKGLIDNEVENENEMSQNTPMESQPYIIPETRHTFDFSELKSRFDNEKRVHKRQRTQEGLDSLEEKVEEEKKEVAHMLVPSAENIADRHNKLAEQQDASSKTKLTVPCEDETIKNNIKASFSIGQQKDIYPDTLADLPKSLAMAKAPLKRKRKLTSNNKAMDIPPPPPKQDEPIEMLDSQETIPSIQPTPTTSMTLSTLTKELSLSPAETIPSSPPASSQLSSSRMRIDANPTIVFTSLSPKLRQRCTDIVNRLGRFEVVSKVDERTTHVVAGKQRRTESIVLGLLRGAWILKPEWLFDVEDETSYTPERHYERSDWITTTTHRKSTLLLDSSTHIWVKSSLSGNELLQKFIELAGGIVASSRQEASIIISEEPLKNCQKPVVSELWIYDCIDAWKFLPVNEYLVE